MEIGFVKQALNNEIIKMKQFFLQAKVHTISKLIKKSKLLREKTAKVANDKLSSKAEQLLNEVFIIKKLKARDIAEFVLRTDKNIQQFLNSPIATREKAISRLITHKSLEDKVVNLKEKFHNMPVDLLLAPGKRQLLKQEKANYEPTKKVKKVKLQKPKLQSTNQSDWIVTEVVAPDTSKLNLPDDNVTRDHNKSLENVAKKEGIISNNKNKMIDKRNSKNKIKLDSKKQSSDNTESIAQVATISSKSMFDNKELKENGLKRASECITKIDTKCTTSKKKSNKLPEKKLKKKIPIVDECFIPEPVGIDTFFVTDTGDNYETLVEKRIEEPLPQSVSAKGNRKMRRAAMFGRPIPCKPTKIKNNDSGKSYKKIVENKPTAPVKLNKHKHIEDRQVDILSLHPSWQAKKKQSNILEFKGKKVTFDE